MSDWTWAWVRNGLLHSHAIRTGNDDLRRQMNREADEMVGPLPPITDEQFRRWTGREPDVLKK